MASIMTYDIPAKHPEFKEKMFELGYKTNIAGEKCKIIYFPNTTLYHSDKEPTEARDDAQQTCKKLGIELTRCVATPWGPTWAAICGEDFK